jgi:hypothetical protein
MLALINPIQRAGVFDQPDLREIAVGQAVDHSTIGSRRGTWPR